MLEILKLKTLEIESSKFGVELKLLDKRDDEKIWIQLDNFFCAIHFFELHRESLEAFLIIPNVFIDSCKLSLLERSNRLSINHLFSSYVTDLTDSEDTPVYGINIKALINFNLSFDQVFYRLKQALYLAIRMQTEAHFAFKNEVEFKNPKKSIQELASDMFYID